MAHEIESNRMVYNGEKPWHDIGIQLNGTESAEEIIAKVYPESIASFPVSARIALDDSTNEYLDFNSGDYQAIVRSDGKLLSVMGSRYEIFQPSESMAFIQDFIDSGLCTFETGMSLFEGKKLVFTAKVKDSSRGVINGDVINNYLNFATSFDGSIATCCTNSITRVVCANTLRMMLSETKGKDSTFKFKHTRNMRLKLDSVRNTIKNSMIQYDKTVEAFQSLTRKKCNDDQLQNYIKAVFEIDDKEELSTKTENKLNEIIELTITAPEKEAIPANRGTYWNAYNGVTRYLTHHAGNSSETRFTSLMFGLNANVNQRALNLALNA